MGQEFQWPHHFQSTRRNRCGPRPRVSHSVILTSGLHVELGPRAVHRGVPRPPAQWGGGDRTQKGAEPEAKTPSPAKPLNPKPPSSAPRPSRRGFQRLEAKTRPWRPSSGACRCGAPSPPPLPLLLTLRSSTPFSPLYSMGFVILGWDGLAKGGFPVE